MNGSPRDWRVGRVSRIRGTVLTLESKQQDHVDGDMRKLDECILTECVWMGCMMSVATQRA